MFHELLTDGLQLDAIGRLAAIVESSDDAIISKTLDGTITSWNRGAEHIFGYTAAEILGQPMTRLFTSGHEDEEAPILARLARGERVGHFDAVRRHKDGTDVDVSVTISPVRDATGRVTGASKIARDIGPQKAIERELRKTRDAAEAAKEIAEAANRAKDRFLSVLSHELRTPLTPVLAAVGLYESGPDLPAAEVRELFRMIRRNVETEARLVDDLLDVTRIIQGKVQLHMEAVDVNAVVHNVVSMLQAEIASKGLEVALALRAKRCFVWADPGRFQQMLLNLLSNAVKFTPPDGRIAVRTANEGPLGDGLSIEVTDSGIGIDPLTLHRLFQPFEQGERTVTRKFGGLGLGLSIVRSLVGLHGGTIVADSKGEGHGATFTLRLATVLQVQPERAPKAATRDPVVAGPARRILLVEDHADTRSLLTRLLRGFGCTVTAAGSVREAIELDDADPFDLVVSDIGLPDGSGLDVIRYLRARRPVRGIALSGFGQDEDLRMSLDAGFDRHLTKPVNFNVLREAIGQLTA